MNNILKFSAVFLILLLYSANGKSGPVQFCVRGATGVCETGAGGWEAFKCNPTLTEIKDCKGTELIPIDDNPN